ncbi:MAG: DUF3298 domain-containing protein [Lachnospiraceae bacterium]|nr:DUF3298 domain-containing protein [Lachnospiraceae bacterium]
MRSGSIKLVCMITASVLLCGCSRGASVTTEPAANVEAAKKEVLSTQNEDNAKDESSDIMPEKVFFSYRNNSCILKNPTSGSDLMSGNYYTIDLDSSDIKLYPDLYEALCTYNEAEEKRVKDSMNSYTADMIEFQNEGFEGSGEVFTDIYLLRADDKAFSFGLLDYSYMGGAHGFTQYYGYCYDPKTGNSIAFSDIVKDTDKLPQIIVDELEKQNELKDYFKECPGDKENLLADIPTRLEDNAKGLAWALDYDGIWLYFEDYAMGAYVAGSQAVKISFADYPDIFTDTYDNYKNGDIPDIKAQAVKKDDAPESVLQAQTGSTEAVNDDPFFGLWVEAFKEKQLALDLVDKLKDKGLEAYSIYSCEYENLNKEPLWCVTIGLSGSEPEAQGYIDDAAKAGFPDAYVKYTGNRLCKRVYCYIYSDQGLEITPSKVTMNDIPTEDLSGNSDAEGPRTLIIDSNTVFDSSCAMQTFGGYKQGESPVEWFNNAKGPDLLGVYDVSITGDHIDAVYGNYWWD